MPEDWSVPQIVVDDDGNMSVEVQVTDDISVDMTDVDTPSDVEDIIDAGQDNIVFDVSGNDVQSIIMSPEAFKSLISPSEATVSENDPVVDENALLEPLMALDARDVAAGNFTPQQWQINLADNRPFGCHYVMTRLSATNNNYVLVLGEDITYSNGIYTYTDADYYHVYSYSSGGSTQYDYSVSEDVSGTISGTSYIVYSDLFFDYLGGRSVDYIWLIIVFLIFTLLVLQYFRRRWQ